jgi:hypothetical protein
VDLGVLAGGLGGENFLPVIEYVAKEIELDVLSGERFCVVALYGESFTT